MYATIIHTFEHADFWACWLLRTYVPIYIYLCTYMCVSEWVCVCVCVYVCVHIYIYIYIYINQTGRGGGGEVRGEEEEEPCHAHECARPAYIYIERKRWGGGGLCHAHEFARERARERDVRRRNHVCGANSLFSLILHIIQKKRFTKYNILYVANVFFYIIYYM